ncbi:MAG TPA: 50S ribosomal protein L21 [Firmicutes bacterium]|nr:50S ribosomal protein L21 [Bacillota bacterium]
MYAVVETGGKQYCVREGDTLRVEKLGQKPGETVEFDRILLVADDEGVVKIGTPVVPGAKVVAKVVSEGKSRKLLVFKYKAKKNYRRRYGHRQPFTEVCIQRILPEASAVGQDVSQSPSDGEEV